MAFTPLARRLVAAVALASAAPPDARGLSFYQVGNSLTADSNPNAVAAMIQSTGLAAERGFHVRGNSTLTDIWNAGPTDFTDISDEHGAFRAALPGFEWDRLVLQASDNGVTTLSQNVAQFRQYRDLLRENPANADTGLYVYGPWPWSIRWSNYDAPTGESPETPSWNQQQTYFHLVDQLNAADPAERWRLIPVGDVFNEVRKRIEAEGHFGGATRIGQLYRDAIHAGPKGQFIAATTIFATLTRTSPVGMPVPRSSNVFWTTTAISDAFALEAQKLVWDVVRAEKRTGVSPYGDVNLDTRVDAVDLAMIQAAYGVRSAVTADANGDGVVDLLDRSVWEAALVAGPADLDDDGLQGAEDESLLRSEYAQVGLSPADLNGDLRVDAADYTDWRDAATLYNSADFNRDGLVDLADEAVWQAQLGWRLDLPEDVNRDGVVDAGDYTLWRDNHELQLALGELPAAARVGLSVPEPAGSGALLSVGLAFLRRRVRR